MTTPYERYEIEIALAKARLKAEQSNCTHVTVTKTERHSEGYDYNEYWTDYDCLYCGKHWRDLQ